MRSLAHKLKSMQARVDKASKKEELFDKTIEDLRAQLAKVRVQSFTSSTPVSTDSNEHIGATLPFFCTFIFKWIRYLEIYSVMIELVDKFHFLIPDDSISHSICFNLDATSTAKLFLVAISCY